jgi:predicted amidohydrolase YtcJ
MKKFLILLAIASLILPGCNDQVSVAKAKADADAAKAAQAKAEAARVKAEAALAKAEADLAKAKAQPPAPDEQPKVYAREEFRELIKEKGTDAVIAAVGKPDKSDESTYKSKDPGSGLPVDVRIMFWTFENRTRDTFTGKIDGRVVVEFRGGGPPNWFVYAVRFQQ